MQFSSFAATLKHQFGVISQVYLRLKWQVRDFYWDFYSV